MKNYEKPVVMVNEGLAEGVYAASGDCWSVTCQKVQDWNNQWTYFQAGVSHSTEVEHISNSCKMTFVFSAEIDSAYSETGICSVSGNTVYVERQYHANAYKNGDLVTFKIGVKAKSEAEYNTIYCSQCYATYCDAAVNVQGGGVNGQ